ncbi:hypothetical protein [Mesorhizobium sp. 113-3-3]|uniref:hypothetical protein n=1 Tax=Mesorhizobium sp. 113-3-3 TaxID=2744516 RepID=UPI0019297856|nr:hypothetical protein [Mesorhizobium sp. 113-3-3]BCG83089.1 hypothetical protein MesoLj113b_66310 [Mesorhizobium sp. 113-3-3]
MEDEEIPTGYHPYRVLNFCGNRLDGVKYVIEISGHHPLLIGSGMFPTVWLLAPTDITRKVWSYVVEGNRSRHPKFRVNVGGTTTQVIADGRPVLVVTSRSDREAEVTSVDLEPIGLRVKGDRNGLAVGGTKIVANSMVGGNVFVALSI